MVSFLGHSSFQSKPIAFFIFEEYIAFCDGAAKHRGDLLKYFITILFLATAPSEASSERQG